MLTVIGLSIAALVRGSSAQCDCEALSRARNVPPRLTPLGLADPAFPSCSSAAPESVVGTAFQCNEPIPAGQDMRGIYGVPQGFPIPGTDPPIPAPQPIPIVRVDQCGDLNGEGVVQYYFFRSAQSSGGLPFVRDFRFDGRGTAGAVSHTGKNVKTDLLNIGSQQCRPTTLIANNLTADDIAVVPTSRGFRLTRFTFEGTPGSRELFSIDDRQVNAPFDLFTVAQIFPPNPPNFLVFPRIAPAFAEQHFEPAECFEQCQTIEEICFSSTDDDDDDETETETEYSSSSSSSSSDGSSHDGSETEDSSSSGGNKRALNFPRGRRCRQVRRRVRTEEAERIWTPCGPAQQTGGGAQNFTVDCGFDAVGRALPLDSLLMCNVRRNRKVPRIYGNWMLSDGRKLTINGCGDRLQLFSVDESHVYDFRVNTGHQNGQGAWGVEWPSANNGREGQLAAYEAKADGDQVTLENIVATSQQITLRLSDSGARRGPNRVLEHSYYDYSTGQTVSLTGTII